MSGRFLVVTDEKWHGHDRHDFMYNDFQVGRSRNTAKERAEAFAVSCPGRVIEQIWSVANQRYEDVPTQEQAVTG